MDAGYWRIVAAEATAGITGAALITGPLHTPDAAVAWVSVVVGVHFIALAAHWHQPLHLHVGTLIAGRGASGLVLLFWDATAVIHGARRGPEWEPQRTRGFGAVAVAPTWRNGTTNTRPSTACVRFQDTNVRPGCPRGRSPRDIL